MLITGGLSLRSGYVTYNGSMWRAVDMLDHLTILKEIHMLVMSHTILVLFIICSDFVTFIVNRSNYHSHYHCR